MNNNVKTNLDKRINNSYKIIEMLISVLDALLCVLAYLTISDDSVRIVAILAIIVIGAILFISIYKKYHVEEVIQLADEIEAIEMVNEENNVVNIWNIQGKISFVIGKSTKNDKVFIDLSNSIYSPLIEEKHAVFNYANGKWYVEDISLNSAITIQKKDEHIKYRVVKESPCEVKKGDILYISKVKLLLK